MTREVTFGTFLAPNAKPFYEFVAERVGQALGWQTRLVAGSSLDQFAAGQIDIAFLCSLPYVRLAAHGILDVLVAPVVNERRYEGKPVYFSDVIVRRESAFHSLEDLRGCRWSYNDPDSYSGYLAPLFRLLTMTETTHFFREWVDAGSHQASIDLILSGEVDASAIDSQVLALEMRRRPDLATALRVIEILGPAPIQPVVVASRFPASMKAEVREVLLGLGSDPAARDALDGGLVERFVPVTDRTYDPIRERLAAVAAAGMISLD